MNYQQRTLKAIAEIHKKQKTGEYSFLHCPLCGIYGHCKGCLSFTAMPDEKDGCSDFKTYQIGEWLPRAEFWQDVIPVLKAIDRKFFTPRFCKSHPEQARKKFAFMLDIDNRIYDKYK